MESVSSGIDIVWNQGGLESRWSGIGFVWDRSCLESVLSGIGLVWNEDGLETVRSADRCGLRIEQNWVATTGVTEGSRRRSYWLL